MPGPTPTVTGASRSLGVRVAALFLAVGLVALGAGSCARDDPDELVADDGTPIDLNPESEVLAWIHLVIHVDTDQMDAESHFYALADGRAGVSIPDELMLGVNDATSLYIGGPPGYEDEIRDLVEPVESVPGVERVEVVERERRRL